MWITVGVSFAASIMGNIDAADNEGIPWFEPMKVKSVSDAERQNLRWSCSSGLRLHSNSGRGGSHDSLRRRGRRSRREFQWGKLHVTRCAGSHSGWLHGGLLRGGLDWERAGVAEGTSHSHNRRIRGACGGAWGSVGEWTFVMRILSAPSILCLWWCVLGNSSRHVAPLLELF